MKNTKVLLTGISGFLGSHTAIQLLEKGYQVTGTLRDMNRADSVREIIGKRTSKIHNLHFAVADLEDEKVWKDLTKGMDYVQHIASPFPRELPKDDDDLVLPAKNGTLNVLKAAAANGVKRVVLTSSTAAIVYGKPKGERNGTFNETQWTDPSNRKDSTPYFRSKTIAEKAAWDFMKTEKSGMELTSVCPGAILGPVLENDFGTSANIVIKTLDGSSPALPDIGFEMVDVRSVADLLILAMEQPQAAGQRYIGSSGYMKFKEVATIIRGAYPERKIPSMVLPHFAVRLFSTFDKSIRPVLIDLGVERKTDHTKAVKDLGWNPLSNREAVLSCAKSVLDLGIVN